VKYILHFRKHASNAHEQPALIHPHPIPRSPLPTRSVGRGLGIRRSNGLNLFTRAVSNTKHDF